MVPESSFILVSIDYKTTGTFLGMKIFEKKFVLKLLTTVLKTDSITKIKRNTSICIVALGAQSEENG